VIQSAEKNILGDDSEAMKRLGNLYEQIIDYENLWNAYLNARKNKRFRGDVLEFTHNVEENLIQIQNELIHKTYKVGKYREFYVYDPKKRLIMALPFKDRVVQWAIYRIIEPILDKQFIYDSYACRKGKGIQKAADRLQYWLRKLDRSVEKPYYLKLDISKYFYRIDHDILMQILERKIKDRDVLWLLETIIRSEDTKFGIPLGDHGFERERIDGIGIPIGNLTSQLFANLYLNELDQYAKHQLHLHYYIRYMDDVVILSEDKKEMRDVLEELSIFLQSELRLQLNNKTAIRPISTGIEFVGYRIWPTHRKLKKKTTKKMKRRLRYLKRAYARGEVSADEVRSTLMSYLGYMKHADCYNLKRKILSDLVLVRSG
jgi:RNA-directed DNA polymerase